MGKIRNPYRYVRVQKRQIEESFSLGVSAVPFHAFPTTMLGSDLRRRRGFVGVVKKGYSLDAWTSHNRTQLVVCVVSCVL